MAAGVPAYLGEHKCLPWWFWMMKRLIVLISEVEAHLVGRQDPPGSTGFRRASQRLA